MKLEIPKQVNEILTLLESHGYHAYIHGECLRALIKGQTTVNAEPALFDFDVLTNADMERVVIHFEESGYKINTDNLDKGEVVVTILGIAVSVTSYFGEDTSLTAELAKEHLFTFDAIAYSNIKGLFDPVGGYDDFSAKKLNFITTGNKFNPHEVIPALTWYASGEFVITETAKAEIFANIESLKKTETADTLEAMLMGRNIGDVLSEYHEVMAAIVPELSMLSDYPELLCHTYKCVGCSSPILALRYALLFHELGKPDCHSKDGDGKEFYYGYAERSRIYTARVMRKLGCKQEVIDDACYIIENYQKVKKMSDNENKHENEYNIDDLRDEFPSLLKPLLLCNYAIFRAESDDNPKSAKKAMKFKKLATMVM